jgi:predicted TPR repeat methyltransferase
MTDSSVKEREVTLEEAMSIAILFQKNGQLAEAEEVYQRIRGVAPDHPDVLHFSGVLAHQQGRSEEAVGLIRRSLELNAKQADCHSNLGIIFKALGRVDEAISAYEQAIALNPDHANAYNNLGVLFRAQGRNADAESAYRTATRINPEHIDAYHNLGVLLGSLKRTQEAVACYCKVTTLSPKHPEARRLLALAHCTLGEPGKAVEIFEKWLDEEPGNAIARHMLAACSGREVPARASDDYVEKVFDDFAASFDEKLGKLSYRAPDLVAAMLADSGVEAAKSLDVLDAGCGTGLCGPLLAPYARRLDGVDLSNGMLARAQERKLYDGLVKDELTEYLRAHEAAYDVIVSADTLVYFGALEQVMPAAAAALRPGGMFIFTLEERPTDAEAIALAGYSISHHGRYTHTRDYVEQMTSEAGLRAEIVRAELRMEAGAPVAGLVVRATRGDAHA